MLTADDLARVRQGRLFHHTDIEDVGPLLEDCSRRDVAQGTALLEPGTPNDTLYLILSGELRVYSDGSALPELATLGMGECAGEMSLIDGQRVSARVIAARDSELLAIPHRVLWAMVERSHGIARNMLTILSGRLRNDNLALVASHSRSLEFEQAASVDMLTGLHNRHWMMESFPRAIERCERDGAPLCLLIADVDAFKHFNDTWGHLVGDAALRTVARQFTDGLRPQDLLARYGGEEFAVLLPHTTTDQALIIAERLRIAVAATPLRMDDDSIAGVTISCGVAPLGLDDSLESLLAAADSALHRAKGNGRNCVELAAS